MHATEQGVGTTRLASDLSISFSSISILRSSFFSGPALAVVPWVGMTWAWIPMAVMHSSYSCLSFEYTYR